MRYQKADRHHKPTALDYYMRLKELVDNQNEIGLDDGLCPIDALVWNLHENNELNHDDMPERSLINFVYKHFDIKLDTYAIMEIVSRYGEQMVGTA